MEDNLAIAPDPPEPKTEITPEMIEAGVWALEQFMDSGTAPERLVRLIYQAMSGMGGK
jgi:hypothetical protein